MNDLMLIQEKIYEIRGQKVMLDFDLAVLYGVTTGNLNKAVKRNIKRFPPDFMFQLTKEELKSLKHFWYSKMEYQTRRRRREVVFLELDEVAHRPYHMLLQSKDWRCFSIGFK